MLKRSSFTLVVLFIFCNATFFNAYASEESFREIFIKMAYDGIMDKKEINELKKISSNEQNNKLAEDTLKNILKFKDRTKLIYSLQDFNSRNFTKLEFTITPTYSEEELIPGSNPLEKISNISQKDNMSNTNTDEDRCGIASLINAYLYMNGDFVKLSNKFNLSSAITYKNIHLLQDIIYRKSNTDNESGIYSGYKYYSSYQTGHISKIIPSGEIVTAANLVGIELLPLAGNNVNTLSYKKEAVENFFYNYPQNALIVGVRLNVETGSISRPESVEAQDHFITIFKYKNIFYLSDTSAINNGDGKNVRKMTKSDLNNLVFNTNGIIYGLLLNN